MATPSKKPASNSINHLNGQCFHGKCEFCSNMYDNHNELKGQVNGIENGISRLFERFGSLSLKISQGFADVKEQNQANRDDIIRTLDKYLTPLVDNHPNIFQELNQPPNPPCYSQSQPLSQPPSQ